MSCFNIINFLAITAACAAALSCSKTIDLMDNNASSALNKRKVEFDITVTRDGKHLPTEPLHTRSGMVDAVDLYATMDKSLPFGFIAVDQEKDELLIDNVSIYNSGKGYSGYFSSQLWEKPREVAFSAYYPHVGSVHYGDSYDSYSIPFTETETEAGPLVSKTVQQAIDQLNMIPLEFQHITNDIGFKICDVTPSEDLQGLMHLRKLTATYVASAGIYLNDLVLGRGYWHKQGYYRQEVVFEGDAPVGVGSENEKFVGSDALVDTMAESHRYYAIPDEIKVGKQCVEVLFDVEGFEHNGFYYGALKNQKVKYMLYGLLPDNVFAYGKQYTFHLGLDLSRIYHEITFAPSVGEWETKIYENNDDF